jgi:sortase (surface protein transpeptidase)
VQRSSPRPAGTATKSVPAPPSLIGLDVPAPVRLRIPTIGLDSRLGRLDRNPDGTIQLPPDLGQPGWYRRGVAPGDLGASVIMGDVGTPPAPGVFSRLASVRVGDAIRIQREDGTEILFVVQRSLVYSPSAFPSAEVYRVSAEPELRLITCGGTAASGGSPVAGDLVVFATLSG